MVADVLTRLVGRFDPDVLSLPARPPTLRLVVQKVPGEVADEVAGDVVGREEAYDVALGPQPRLQPAGRRRPSSVLMAAGPTWEAIAADPASAWTAVRSGDLRVRGSVHLAFGFLAGVSGDRSATGLRFGTVATPAGRLALLRAGSGPPLVCLHGLGGTKVSMLPLVRALAPAHEIIALDLPGFGESVKPLRARYDARWFAQAVVGALDALGLSRTHLLGHSLGGRIALEVALREPDRVHRLALLTPAMAWLRRPAWESLVRVAPARLGALQPAPRRAMRRLITRLVTPRGGVTHPSVDLAVEEFLRGFGTPGGRVAFYSAARNIALDAPTGDQGLWTRLAAVPAQDVLFVWGRRDRLVPLGFARHVERVLPDVRQVELDCGHLPQVERPRELSAALRQFLAG